MIGRQISHFFVLRELGRGGSAVVYEAQDTRLPRAVAIKCLQPALAAHPGAVRRLRREGRCASLVSHPNVCTILDADDGEGPPFVAMELLHGRSLAARLAEGPLGLAELVEIGAQVASGLAAAHEQGISHGDVAPGNLFLTDDGFVKLLDFGLARMDAEPDDGEPPDAPNAGTLHYMAPERLAPDASGASADQRADLYSLGAVLYRMATGSCPHERGSRRALIAAVRHASHVPLHERAPHHPAALGDLVDRLLDKRAARRPDSARAVRAALDATRGTPAADAVPWRRTAPTGRPC